MLSGLTLSVLLFFLLVLFPGYLAMLVAGRSKSERNLSNAAFFGSMLLAAYFGGLYLSKLTWGTPHLDDFIGMIGHFTSGVVENVDLNAMFVAFGIMYAAAFVVGAMELLLLTKWAWPQKVWAKLIRFLSKGEVKFQVKPGNFLCDVLIAYRIVGRRPLVKLQFSDGRNITCECLKYSWNKGESLFVRDADRPELVRWISLNEVFRIEFLNTATVQNNRSLLTDQDKLLLDMMIYPGYSEEVEEKMRRKTGER